MKSTSSRASKQSGIKHGKVDDGVSFNSIAFSQAGATLYLFAAKASQLWNLVSINRRDPEKDEGYQRVLPNSRIKSLSKFIQSGKPLPNSVLISFEKATFANGILRVPKGTDVGWVIDGQHRLAGAHEAAKEFGVDYDIPVVAFIDLPLDEQVEQFITINREAKGVPSSLLLDLLKALPTKRPIDVANERSADIAKALRDDPESPLVGRIVIDRPGNNQVSLINFVRKLNPLVHAERGRLREFTLEEQKTIIENYFSAIRDLFIDEWNRDGSIFFKTVGFGAIMNVFEKVFNESSERFASFQTSDVKKILGLVANFDFGQWSQYGSGNKAEQDASRDLLIDLNRGLKKETESGKIRRLKL